MGETVRQNSREWDSAAYHRLSEPQFAWGRKVLGRLSVRGDETVVDAGCGTGRLTAELLQLLPRGRVLAVDLSENMLRAARQHLAANFRNHVQFVAADLQALPLLQMADGIFSTAAFHWVRDHERLFRSLYAALWPGGWLEAQCGGGANLAPLLRRAAELAASAPFKQFFDGWQTPWEYASPETTADRLRRAGFVEVRTGLEHTPTPLQNAESYREYLATVTLHRHADRIPDAAMRREFFEILTRQAAIENPPFLMDYWRLNISARRPR